MASNINFSSMSSQDLVDLQARILAEHAQRKQQLPAIYGEWFSSIIGAETLYAIPEVKAETLGLDRICKYPQDVVMPSMLKTVSAVRGIMSLERPFIAMKFTVKDAETQEILGIFAEVVFSRLSKSRERYVTSLTATQEGARSRASFLYSTGCMTEKHLEVVRVLLTGNWVRSPVKEEYLLQLVQPQT